MNDLLFIGAQFPATWLSTVLWFTAILPAMPESIQEYRKYDVVRVVDYLTKDSFYYVSTWIIYVIFLIYYAIRRPEDKFPLYFSLMSWINILGMEFCLQVSGKRQINFRHSAYWTGSNVLSMIVQTLREGAVCFGLPALIVQGLLQQNQMDIYWFAVIAAAIDTGGLAHLLVHVKDKRKRVLGSTQVIGRRKILDTIAYRFGELYVIYYVYQKYPEMFMNMKDFITIVTIYRSLQLGVFFAVGTYYGQTYIDAGPKNYCEDTWFYHIPGILFRVFESTLSGYPKTIVLTFLLQKWIESRQ